MMEADHGYSKRFGRKKKGVLCLGNVYISCQERQIDNQHDIGSIQIAEGCFIQKAT